jgi:DNA-directed RNA polymerase sigma subunit (sigma70/sigma32)
MGDVAPLPARQSVICKTCAPFLREFLDDRSALEDDILAMRFGLPPYSEMTSLGEISAAVGLPVPEVRRTEAHMVSLLRHPSRQPAIAALPPCNCPFRRAVRGAS